jgi:hypothetical protein
MFVTDPVTQFAQVYQKAKGVSIGDYVVYPFAGLVLAFLTFMAVRHWKGVGIGVVALSIVVAVVSGPPIAWQRCKTTR